MHFHKIKYGFMAARTVFLDGPEVPAVATKKPESKTPERRPIDEQRILQDIREIEDNLHFIKDNDKKELEAFQKKLEAIKKKYKKSSDANKDALKELEAEIYRDCAVLLEKLIREQLKGLKNIQQPHLGKNKLSFSLGGEKMTAELNDFYRLTTLEVLGCRVKFSRPLELQNLNDGDGNNLLGILRLIAKSFDLKSLDITADRGRLEFTVFEKAELKKYVATTQDLFEVKEEPSQEDIKKFKTAQKNSDELFSNFRKFAAGPGPMFLEPGEYYQADPNEKATDGHGKIYMVKKLLADSSKLTTEERIKWDLYLVLRKDYLEAKKKTDQLEKVGGSRKLEKTDAQGQKVRAVEFVNLQTGVAMFDWTYLDAQGKPSRKLDFVAGAYCSKEEFEDGKAVRESKFMADGVVYQVRDFKKGTEDHYNLNSKPTFRRNFDPSKWDGVVEADNLFLASYLYNAEGKLVDEKLLQTMSAAEIEKFYFQKLDQKEDVDEAAKACISVAKIISKCQGGQGILFKAARILGLRTFDEFPKFKDLPYAKQMLEIVAYEREKPETVRERLKQAIFDSLTAAEKERIVALVGRKNVNFPLGERLLSTPKIHEDIDKTMLMEFTNELLEDPALMHLADVREEWLDFKRIKIPDQALKTPEMWKIQIMAMVARNLFFKNLDVTELNVKKEFRKIYETRERYKQVEIFKGRNVLLAAHSELIGDLRQESREPEPDMPYTEAEYADWEKEAGDTHYFGRIGLQDAIKKDQAGKGSFELIRPDKRLESIKKAKEAILLKIKTTPPPLTLIFDAHGGPDAIYFYGGEIAGTNLNKNDIVKLEAAMKIDVREMAEALTERAKKFPQLKTNDPNKKDILIFSCCFNSTFIHNLFLQLGDIPKPIALGMSEFGQYGYGSKNSPLGSGFFSEVIGLGQKSKKSVTFGNVFENEFNWICNPSLYIPDQQNITMQIARTESSGGSRQV